MEIRDALNHPEGPENFISHIPVHQDGSCNGLQHYAALGRDEYGGTYVNVVPGEAPQDVYSEIATLVEEKRAEAEAETFLDVHSCHTCSECNARFSSDTSLRAHIADLHTLVQCPQCGVQVIQSTCFIYG